MAHIHIHRAHQLGLPQARLLASQWTTQARTEFELECHVVASPTGDTISFSRSGVKGELRVAADHFTVDATLGFFLAAFSETFKHKIEKTIDKMLLEGAAGGGVKG